jgi:predicted AAA+ superfamily ATPase
MGAKMKIYKRPCFKVFLARLTEQRRFIQVLAGPRQSGKTTLARQIIEEYPGRSLYASADEPAIKNRTWIEQQWNNARQMIGDDKKKKKGLFILDEIQKIPGWSEAVKHLWDQDTAKKLPLRILILGSSPLLVQQGLTESLAGRFETMPITHWSFPEMREAFGWSLEKFLYYGGYPGAVTLTEDHERWARYIHDSLIETTVSRDVLLMTRIDKPALLRRLFDLGCHYSGQILSYQKMLGQLQEAGNTVTLAHYLQLLHGAGLIAGISKYTGADVRQRGSSPKFIVLNNAFMTSSSPYDLNKALKNPDFWGRIVESAVGGALLNGTTGTDIKVHYWAGRNREVDFILNRGDKLTAIEVKSGRQKTSLPGIDAFSKEFPVSKKFLIGAQGMPLENFFELSPQSLM